MEQRNRKLFLFAVLGFSVTCNATKNADDTTPAPAERVAPSIELPRKVHFGRVVLGLLKQPMAVAVSSPVLYYPMLTPKQSALW